MKKILCAVLFVALSSPAFAAGENAPPAPSAQEKAAKDKAAVAEQREQQFVHETHASPAKKKAKKGAKKSANKTESSGSSGAAK